MGTTVQKCHKGDKAEYNGIKNTITRVFGHMVKIEDEHGNARWVNRKNIEIFDYYKENIARHDERIAHNQEIIDENKLLHRLASDAIRINRKEKNAVLREAGVNSASQIQDKELLDKYNNFCVKLWDAITMRNRATSAICSAAISTSSECSAKINDIYGQAIAEKTLMA